MTHNDIEAEESGAFAQIGALSERELAEGKASIAGGCQGRQPRPDAETRVALAERLTAPISDRQAPA